MKGNLPSSRKEVEGCGKGTGSKFKNTKFILLEVHHKILGEVRSLKITSYMTSVEVLGPKKIPKKKGEKKKGEIVPMLGRCVLFT